MAFTRDVSSAAESLIRNHVRMAPLAKAQAGTRGALGIAPKDVKLPSLDEEVIVELPPGLLEAVSEGEIWNRIIELAEANTPISFRKPGESIAEGDEVLVDLHVRENGEVVQDSVRVDALLPMTDDAFLPELKDKILGRFVGERVILDLNLSSDPLLNRPPKVQFHVFIKAARYRGAFDLNDFDFVRTLGLGTTPEEVTQTVLVQLEREREMSAQLTVKNAVLDALAARSDIQVAKEIVDESLRAHWTKHEGRLLAEHGFSRRDQEASLKGFMDSEENRAEAERRARIAIMLGEWAKRDGITVEKADFRRWCDEQGFSVEQVQELKTEIKNDKASALQLLDRLLHLKMVDHVMSKVKVRVTTALS